MKETRKQKTADYKTENKLIGTRNSRKTKLRNIISSRGKKQETKKLCLLIHDVQLKSVSLAKP